MREFNTTGTCIPEKHFMVDISGKLAQITKMIDRGKYFTISRPRQYGKTTTLYMLERKLQGEYVVIRISFEGLGNERFLSEKSFAEGFLLLLKKEFTFAGYRMLADFVEENQGIPTLDILSDFITRLCDLLPEKRFLLMIDEVDQSSNYQLFLNFLGILRHKYLLRSEGKDRTFHSVILAGVHDVKTLKLKIRPEEERRYNSPWNIAVDFQVEMSFSPAEITTMLTDYARERNVALGLEALSEKIFYYTSGYPFLVSKICEVIDTELMSEPQWDVKDVDAAVNLILKENNPNFESLIKNLENHRDLYDIVQSMIIDGEVVGFNLHNPVIYLGLLFGIFRDGSGKTQLHNHIYAQVVYNFMASKMETAYLMGRRNHDEFATNNALDLKSVLLKFQQFMRENYSDKDEDFLERQGKLLFLAFLRPIINGKGFDFKEVQISEEKRLDVVITYLNRKYVVELKVWRGMEYHQKGIKQLADYIERVGLDQGYLVIFDPRKLSGEIGRQERVDVQGKDVFMVWV